MNDGRLCLKPVDIVFDHIFEILTHLAIDVPYAIKGICDTSLVFLIESFEVLYKAVLDDEVKAFHIVICLIEKTSLAVVISFEITEIHALIASAAQFHLIYSFQIISPVAYPKNRITRHSHFQNRYTAPIASGVPKTILRTMYFFSIDFPFSLCYNEYVN